jgi:HK97 family phage major capsid protein
MTSFSILRAISCRANNIQLYGQELQIHNAGSKEFRTAGIPFDRESFVLPLQTRGVISVGSAPGAIAEDKTAFVEPLRNALVLVQAGARFLPGLTADISFPVYSGSTASWKGETEPAGDGAGVTTEVNLTPKRLTTYLDISALWLTQAPIGAEEMLLNDIVRAVANKLESTILGEDAGTATQPAGIFLGAPSLGALDFAKIVDLETEIATAQDAYITNSIGRGKMKTTPANTTAARYIWEGGEANGYPVLVTNGVFSDDTEFGVVFGNWNELVIGSWGAVELTVDPFSQKAAGCIRIVINAYFDAAILRSAAFKAVKFTK